MSAKASGFGVKKARPEKQGILILSLLNTLPRNICAIILRMKLLFPLVPFVLASLGIAAIPAAQDLGNFEPIFVGLAQLPLVGGMAWILMRQQDKHQDTIDKLIAHFSARSEQKDEMWNTTFEKLLDTIKEMSANGQ